MNSKTSYIKVIKTSDWKGGTPGTLPARIVMWQPNDEKAFRSISTECQYATHIEVKHEDGTKSFYHGHYDMTKAGAEEDFGRRVAAL